MPYQRPPAFGNSEFLRKLLILRALQQQQNGQASNAAPQQENTGKSNASVKDVVELIKSVRKLYGAADGATASTPAVATPASQIAWNADAIGAGGMSSTPALTGPASNPAELAAWNSSADAATSQAAASEAGTTFADVAPWLAVAASAVNSGMALTNKNKTDEQKAFEGSMAVPRAVGAYYTLGLSNLGEGLLRKKFPGAMQKVDKFLAKSPLSPIAVPMAISRLWTSDKWKTEGNRLGKLEKNGITIPDALKGAMQLQRGRRKEELVNPNVAGDFIGNTPQYGWVNNKFANSRNESDLRPEDIWGYSSFFEKYGNDWLGKFNEQQRRAIAQTALDKGAVNEHHGTIDIDWSKVGDPASQQAPAGTTEQPTIARPAPGQVARLSPGVYRNSNGQIQMGNRIPRSQRSRT